MGKKKDIKKKDSSLVIQMDKKFKNFDKNKRKAFEDDLVKVTDKRKIKRIKYDEGCVLFTGTLDTDSVDRLVNVFENKDNERYLENNLDIINFLKKHSISNIRKIEKSKLTIIIKNKNRDTQYNNNKLINCHQNTRLFVDYHKNLLNYVNKNLDHYLKSIWENIKHNDENNLPYFDFEKEMTNNMSNMIHKFVQETMRNYKLPFQNN